MVERWVGAYKHLIVKGYFGTFKKWFWVFYAAITC